MSYFGDKLQHLMEINSVTGPDVQRDTHINPSRISRWISGKQKLVSPKDMDLLCKAVCKTKSKFEYAELAVAHLKDECFGPGAELVEILIAGTEIKPQPTRITNNERMFEFLQKKSIKEPSLKKIFLHIALHEGFDKS
jgi:Cro/C1-type HTH DNA-binding domain